MVFIGLGSKSTQLLELRCSFIQGPSLQCPPPQPLLHDFSWGNGNIFTPERRQGDSSTHCGETMSLLGSLLGAWMTQRQFRHQKVHPSMSDDPRFPSQLVGSFTQEGSQLTSTPSNCFSTGVACREGTWDFPSFLGLVCVFWELLELLNASPSSSRRGTLQCRGNATSPSTKEQNLPLQVPSAETDPQDTLKEELSLLRWNH